MHMSKLKEILQGYTKLLMKDPETEAQALERLAECKACPSTSTEKWTQAMRNAIKGTTEYKEIEEATCGICGCALMAKARSKDSVCPRGRWGESYMQLEILRDQATEEEVRKEIIGKMTIIENQESIHFPPKTNEP